MIFNSLWRSWLVSPAILGATLFTSSGVLAQDSTLVAQAAGSVSESPLSTTVIPESAIATAVPTSVADLKSKQETSTAINSETSVPMAEVPVNGNQPDILEQIDRYSNESKSDSVELNDNSSPLEDRAFQKVDSSESNVIEQLNQYSDADALDQVTNVTQLRDVSPGDWAFEALRSLVERYGCIAGYPDGTYRGNRAMTRYEFAAGLNACLQQIERLIGTRTEGFVTKEDLTTLQRLIEEFGTELAQLRGRVDALEARTNELERTQFSTTTKLNGVALFTLTGIAAGQNALGEDIDNVAALGYRVRLNFDTSFTGKDVLRTRLQSVNLPAFSGASTFTPEGDLRFAEGTFGADGANDVVIDALLYAFPIGEKTTVVIEANAGAPDDFTNTINPGIDGDGDTGALSNFATRNPIYNLVGGTGIGIRHEFSDALELSLGYLAPEANDPSEGAGLFDGAYGAIAQVTFKPFEPLTLGLTYVHSYNTILTAGSNRANLRGALLDNPNLPAALAPLAGLSLPVSSNSYGLEASFQLSPKILVGGWVGYTATRTLSTLGGLIDRGDLSAWNWAATLTFPDLGKEGSVAALIVGMEPKVTGVSNSLRSQIGEDQDTSLHIEGFYQFQLTENIFITPGVIWITAPDHNANNDDIVIGTIRTTFTF